MPDEAIWPKPSLAYRDKRTSGQRFKPIMLYSMGCARYYLLLSCAKKAIWHCVLQFMSCM